MTNVAEKLRIDKWLWFARVAKTRSLAAKLVTSGNVRLNKDKVTTASRSVKIDDVLTIARGDQVLIYRVLTLGTRRGPASEAQLLYEDLSPVVEKTPKKMASETREAGLGRPTKRDRRQIMRMKQSGLDD